MVFVKLLIRIKQRTGNKKMDFYSNISRYYDEIFPLNNTQVDFIESFFTQPFHNVNILDAGCGTGVLAIELARRGFNVHAIDFEPQMIRNAVIKKEKLNLSGSPIFDEADMRVISQKFIPGTFNAVISFGNTLVHLLKSDDIISFVDGAKRVLKENGFFLLQILNYNYILANKIGKLPVIENESVIFERYYDFRHNDFLSFITRLTVKKDGRAYHNEIKLNPVNRETLAEILTNAGFRDLGFYGDFEKHPLKEDSLTLVIEASKRQL